MCLVERRSTVGDLNAVLEPTDGRFGLGGGGAGRLKARVPLATGHLARRRAGQPGHQVDLQVNPRYLALNIIIKFDDSVKPTLPRPKYNYQIL